MGMTKIQTSLFLAVFFATLVICAVVICTCAYCYKPSYFSGIRRSRSSSDYSTTTSSGSDSRSSSGSDDIEKAPRGRVVGRTTERAAHHPSDHSDYDLEAEEIDVVHAVPGDDHGHHHHHHGHAEPIDIIHADPSH